MLDPQVVTFLQEKILRMWEPKKTSWETCDPSLPLDRNWACMGRDWQWVFWCSYWRGSLFATEPAKVRKDFGDTLRKSVCVESAINRGRSDLADWKGIRGLLRTWNIFHHGQPLPVVPYSKRCLLGWLLPRTTAVDWFAPPWSCPFNPQGDSSQILVEASIWSGGTVQN